MIDFLKEVGTTEVARDSLKIDVNKPASWSAQDLRTRPVIPSGPAAFLTFTLLRALRTSSSDTVITWLSLHCLLLELKVRLNSLPVSEFGGSYCTSESIARCFVLAHILRQKSLVVCGSAFVNRSTDCSVNPRFLIQKGPYSHCFCSLLS